MARACFIRTLVTCGVVVLTAVPRSRAETLAFTAQLRSSNEVPPVNNADQSGSGNAAVTLTITRDASNNVTSAIADFNVTLNGFSKDEQVILAHVSMGTAGSTGPVVIDSGLNEATAITFTNGVAAFDKSDLEVSAETAAAVIAEPGNFYFEVHTTLSPDGAARGQLMAASTLTPTATMTPTATPPAGATLTPVANSGPPPAAPVAAPMTGGGGGGCTIGDRSSAAAVWLMWSMAITFGVARLAHRRD